ncbi:MAG: hypothetical protein IT232_03265, partial [Flavobacteriales bacterium]|nr:hypothetical protein [Flavobacteriales bacterium]
MKQRRTSISWMKTEESTGKLPPSSVDEEKYIVGTILTDNKAIEYCDRLKPFHFYKEEHKLIFELMLILKEEGRTIDIISITQTSYKKKYNDRLTPYFITQISNYCVMDLTELDYLINSIIEYWIRRELILLNSMFIAETYDLSNDL